MTDIAEMAKSLDYNRGLLPPNFPVPAIPLKIRFGGITWKSIAIVTVHPPYRIKRLWENADDTT